MKDYYSILGVDKKASTAEIKKVYRKKARKFHPDLNPGDKAAEKKFKEINEAYEVLKDDKKRKQYDTFGRVGDFNQGAGQSGNFSGFDFGSSGTSSFSDIFETIFGGGTNANFTNRGRKQNNHQKKGEDIQYSITLSFEDAAMGVETPIQLYKKESCQHCKGNGIEPGSSRTICPQCSGSGQTQKQMGAMKFSSHCNRCNGSGYLPGEACKICRGEGREDKTSKIKVKIPPAVEDGAKLRIANKGNVGYKGGPVGDLLLIIKVMPHKFFTRKGLDLELTLPLTYAEAALGAKVTIPLLKGETQIKIPPETPSGRKLRLKGKGLISAKGIKGNLTVNLKIVPPSIKDIDVRKKLQEIEKIYPYNPRNFK